MKRRLTLAVSAICASAAIAAVAEARPDLHPWRPSRDLVAHIDSMIEIPVDSGGPRDNFDRYYTGIVQDGRRVVLVEMLNLENDGRRRTIHILDYWHMPAIGDGGCGVVNGTYDVEKDRLSDLACNFDMRPPPPPPLGQ